MIDAHAIAAAAAPATATTEGAWIVGGAVRDALLHRRSDDLDVAVAGDPERFARTLAGALGGAAFSYSERFSAWRVACQGGHVDVAPLRGATIEDDLRGRDFTINALARPLTGESAALVDPCGGLADLRARRLAPCTAGAFDDDPVRVVRLARLRYEFDLSPAPGLEAAAAAAAGALAGASPERLQHELSTLLGGRSAAVALRCLDDLGALVVALPELTACHGVTQNPYHHLDVFDHTLEALAFLPQVVAVLGGVRYLAPGNETGLAGAPALAPLAWAVLLHDVGKPAARRVDDGGRVTFFSHDRIGEGLVRDVCRRLRVSRRFEEFLADLVRQHLRLGFLVREMPLTRRALVRFRHDVEPFVFEAIALSMADRVATRGERTPPQSLARHFRIARDVFGDTPAPPRRLLDGAQVMALLGLAEGAAVGRALDVLQEEIDCGVVTTPSRPAPSARLVGARAGGSERCLSCPRSRSCVAAFRPAAGLVVDDIVVNDPVVSVQTGARSRRAARSSHRGAAPARQVPDRGAQGRSAGRAPAITGRLLLAPEPGVHAPRRSCSSRPAVSSFSTTRAASAACGRCRPQTRTCFPASDPSRSARTSRPRICRAPSRPARRRSSRSCSISVVSPEWQHLRRRGPVPGPSAPAADRRHAGPRRDRPAARRAARDRQLGIEHEGASIESFVDPSGARGAFQEILNVYGRGGEPCRMCGTAIERVELGGAVRIPAPAARHCREANDSPPADARHWLASAPRAAGARREGGRGRRPRRGRAAKRRSDVGVFGRRPAVTP